MALDFPAPAVEGQTFVQQGATFIYHNSRWMVIGQEGSEGGEGGAGISNVVEDTTPQLGGDLDLNGHIIEGMVIGVNVQAYNPALTGTEAPYTGDDQIKLHGLPTAAQYAVDLALKANLASPNFSGTPSAPNVTAGDISTRIANTAFVNAAVAASVGGVSDEVVQDIVGGMVTGNTETNISVTYDDTNGKLNFVATGGSGGVGDVVGPAGAAADAPALFDGVTGKLLKQTTYGNFKSSLAIVKGDVSLGNVDNTSDANKPVSTAQQTALDLKAPLASPALSGTPTTPNVTAGDSSTKIANTAFVTGANATQDTATATALGLKANLASPALSGTPTAPNVTYPDSSTKIANTAYVTAAVAATGGGNVVGPAGAVVNNAPVLFDTTTGKLLKETNYPAFKSSLALTKGDVGLGNVDNTADIDKPVSTATATAIAAVDTDLLTELLALDETDSMTAATALLEGVSSPDGVIGFDAGVLVTKPYLPTTGAADRTLMYDGTGAVKLATHAEAKVAYFGALTGSMYSTAGVISVRSAAQQATDMFSALTGGLYSTAGVMTAFAPWGKNNLWVPAGAMDARLTNGATRSDYGSLLFATGSDTFALFEHWMPKAYNASTLTAQFVWKHPATTTNFSVTWAIQASCINNDDAYTAAYGTAVVVTDDGGTTDDVYVSPATGAITLGGTPAKERFARFQVYRDVDGNGTATNDDLAVDAQLLGIILSITTNAATDD